MTLAVFHDFPGLENGLTKFHDFPGRGGDKPVSYQQQHIYEVTCITSSVCHFWWLKWLRCGCVVTEMAGKGTEMAGTGTEMAGGADTDVSGTRAPVVLVMSLTTLLFNSACSIWFSSTTSNSRHFNLSMSACKHQSLTLNTTAAQTNSCSTASFKRHLKAYLLHVAYN